MIAGPLKLDDSDGERGGGGGGGRVRSATEENCCFIGIGIKHSNGAMEKEGVWQLLPNNLTF